MARPFHGGPRDRSSGRSQAPAGPNGPLMPNRPTDMRSIRHGTLAVPVLALVAAAALGEQAVS